MTRTVRQSFLGKDSDAILASTIVGIVGLGGGGSHIVQQLAHLGVVQYVLADPDMIDLGNTNRLVGGTLQDVSDSMPKVDIAARIIRGIHPEASIHAAKTQWSLAVEQLKTCDVIFGAVDSYKERDELERFCRRFLVPYIDIGMDVADLGPTHGFLISGQVILSAPGHPCLWCCGFLNQDKLAVEAQRYGDAGGRPQVVWPNGVLASTAVGFFVQLATTWHTTSSEFAYLEYDGNRSTVVPSAWMKALVGQACPHHPPQSVGDPLFDIRTVLPNKT